MDLHEREEQLAKGFAYLQEVLHMSGEEVHLLPGQDALLS